MAEPQVWRTDELPARTVSPVGVREALEQAIGEGRGIVVLEVRRPGQQAVRARVAQMCWAAVWDALALDADDEDEHAQGAAR